MPPIFLVFLAISAEFEDLEDQAILPTLAASETQHLLHLRNPTSMSLSRLSRQILKKGLERQTGHANWEILRGETGRPIVGSCYAKPPFPTIGLSHRKGFVTAVFCIPEFANPKQSIAAQPIEIGVDAEPLDQTVQTSILDVAFSEKERDRLRGLAEAQLQFELVRRWTIKEAIAKASGQVGIDRMMRICTAMIPCAWANQDGLSLDSMLARSTLHNFHSNPQGRIPSSKSIDFEGKSFQIAELLQANHWITVAGESHESFTVIPIDAEPWFHSAGT